jgi:uncharacterized protein (TIGR02594 family)
MGAAPEPVWLQLARADIGLREVPGAPTAPRIAGWLAKLRAWWRDDETPWCGVAVAGWMLQAGIDDMPKHWYRARGWLDWGLPLEQPAVGAVVVFAREGGGHVGLVVGRDHLGRLLVLGGNQGNAVSIAPFETTRVLGYRWPADRRVLAGELPVTYVSGPSSRGEA